MIINNGSQLSVEYFKSYFRLVMNSQQCTVIEAKEIIFNRILEEIILHMGIIHFKTSSMHIKK